MGMFGSGGIGVKAAPPVAHRSRPRLVRGRVSYNAHRNPTTIGVWIQETVFGVISRTDIFVIFVSLVCAKEQQQSAQKVTKKSKKYPSKSKQASTAHPIRNPRRPGRDEILRWAQAVAVTAGRV